MTERRWKTFAVVLSQQHDEAGGSLNRETPVRVASSPDNAGTGQYYRMVRVRQARREGVREEPVLKASQVSRQLKSGGYGLVCDAHRHPLGVGNSAVGLGRWQWRPR